MSSVILVQSLSPVVTARGVTLGVANVSDASVKAGFNAGFAITVDQEHNTKWVNPTPFVPILIDCVKGLVKENAALRESVEELKRSLNAHQELLETATKRMTLLETHATLVDNGIMDARERLSCLEGDTSNFGKFTELFKDITAEESVEVSTEIPESLAELPESSTEITEATSE